MQPAVASAATTAVADDVELERSNDSEKDGRFRETFGRHYASLHAYFQRALGSYAEAEEATQETLFRLFAHQAHLRIAADDEIRAWLYSVARNHAIDLLRRSGRTEQLTSPEDIASHSDRAQERFLITEPGADFGSLRALIERLPHRQRLLLGLRYHLSFTTAEAAEALGITPENARQTERRALSFLRARI
jgi:RNA polymerase sigma-70 factor (ECF subfamily)